MRPTLLAYAGSRRSTGAARVLFRDHFARFHIREQLTVRFDQVNFGRRLLATTVLRGTGRARSPLIAESRLTYGADREFGDAKSILSPAKQRFAAGPHGDRPHLINRPSVTFHAAHLDHYCAWTGDDDPLHRRTPDMFEGILLPGMLVAFGSLAAATTSEDVYTPSNRNLANLRLTACFRAPARLEETLDVDLSHNDNGLSLAVHGLAGLVADVGIEWIS